MRDLDDNDPPPSEHGDPGDLEEIRVFIDELLASSGLDLTPTLSTEQNALVIELNGDDSALLLERGGEVLAALQLLLGKILPRRFGTTMRILVDSANYRIGRENEIIEIARLTAERVKKLGTPFELSPMNPYERRLVHMALASDLEVQTESSGDSFLKRIRISPRAPK